ncbi:unnamed protein product [Prunus armeniaca]
MSGLSSWALDLPLAQGKHISIVEVVEGLVANEAAIEEDDALEGSSGEMAIEAVEQAVEAAEQVAK